VSNAPVSVPAQTPSRRPPPKALPSRRPGTAWAPIIFQRLDCQWFGVARLLKRKQRDLAQRWPSLMKFLPRSFGRTETRLDNAFTMRAKMRLWPSVTEAPTLEGAPI